MKQKKGFALLTTIAVMLLVVCMSGFIVVMVTSVFKVRNYSLNLFERKLILTQIANDYNSKTKDEFIDYYVGLAYEKNQLEDEVTLDNDNIHISIKDDEIEILSVEFKDKKGVNLTIKKDENNIIFWKYGK